MPPLPLLYVLFLVGIIYGILVTRRRIRTMRKAEAWPNTLYQWSATPLSSWKLEPIASTAILIHAIAVFLLGLLTLRAASNPGIMNNSLFANDRTIQVLVWFIQCGSILLVTNQAGTVLVAFLMTVYRKEPIALAITEGGMGFGRYFLPWRWFSHFSVDEQARIVRQYSAFAPDLPALINQIPDRTDLAEIRTLLSKFLPQEAPQSRRAWYRSQRLLIPVMLLACILVLTAGLVVIPLTRELALFLYAVLTTALVLLGGVVLTKFAFGILFRGSGPGLGNAHL